MTDVTVVTRAGDWPQWAVAAVYWYGLLAAGAVLANLVQYTVPHPEAVFVSIALCVSLGALARYIGPWMDVVSPTLMSVFCLGGVCVTARYNLGLASVVRAASACYTTGGVLIVWALQTRKRQMARYRASQAKEQ